MRGKIFFCLLFLIIIPVGSSSIILQESFYDLYNFGEVVYLNFSIEKQQDASGFIDTFLECDEEVLVNREYIGVEKGIKKYFLFEVPLTEEGECEIKIEFFGEIARSEEFKISDKVLIEYNLNDILFFPGEEIKINGTAKLEGGRNLNGYVEVRISGLVERVFEVENGKFSFNFNIDKSASPKNYELILEAYDKNFDEKKLNSGIERKIIEIKEVVSSLLIYSPDSFSIPSKVNFSVDILNQAQEKMLNESVSIKIFNPNNDIVFDKSVKGGENFSYEFFSNSPRGGWRINTYYGDIFSSKTIYVEENKKIDVDFDLGREVLILKNVGNVNYEGVYAFSVSNNSGNFQEISINLSLDIGETHEEFFGLTGTYNISLPDQIFSNVVLTGYAISSNLENDERNYYIGFGIILIFILIWFFVFKKKIFFKDKQIKENNSFIPKEKEEIKKEESGVINKNYLLFIECENELEKYSSVVEKYGFKLRRVNSSVGYVLFSLKESKNFESKLFSLARAIKRFADLKRERISISLSVGQFENKVDSLKKFALFSRNLLKFSKGKIVMTEKFFKRLGISLEKEEGEIEAFGRKMKIYRV